MSPSFSENSLPPAERHEAAPAPPSPHPNSEEVLQQRPDIHAALGQTLLFSATAGRSGGVGALHPLLSHRTAYRTDRLGIGTRRSRRALPRTGMAAHQEMRHAQNPKEIIDNLILELPDNPPAYTRKGAIPPSEPSRLERYFTRMAPGLTSIDMNHHRQGALAPQDSIDCLRDKVRTKLFMQGIAEAVAQLDSTPQDTIEVCDAGTGAIPVMAIYAALCSDKVRCTALELNPQSARLARQVVVAFGLQSSIAVIEADATKYRPPKPLDLLISETMHSGLTNEPMVQILSNLQPHVKPAGITLPSAVNIKAALVPYESYNNPRGYIKIQEGAHHFIEPAWQEIMRYVPGQQLDKITFDLDGRDLPEGEYVVAVTNDVVIGSGKLKPFQSLITMPQYPLLCFPGSTLQRFAIAPSSGGASGVSVSYRPGTGLTGAARTTSARR